MVLGIIFDRILGLILSVGGEKIFEEAGDGGGADTADFWGDGRKVVSVVESWVEIATKNAFFAGSAGIDKNSVGRNQVRRDETWDTCGGNNKVEIFELS